MCFPQFVKPSFGLDPLAEILFLLKLNEILSKFLANIFSGRDFITDCIGYFADRDLGEIGIQNHWGARGCGFRQK
jgi:hypothetical protein